MRFITWIASVAVAWSGNDPPALVVGEVARGEAAPVRGVAQLFEAPERASVVELRVVPGEPATWGAFVLTGEWE
ncbi:MAG: hypothetical protein JNL90_12360 [Planctomycetes bacterium]|nr:hypothetical protein [Planctomycetota bacterium]